jgi:hypothetical protein
MRISRRRFLPGLLAGVVVVGVAVAVVIRASRSEPELPQVSAASLIASMVRAAEEGTSVSGAVEMTVDLGLPKLVDLGTQGGPLSLLSGTHELRLWRSADGFRISDLEPAGERGLFVFHGHAWAWSFDSLTAFDLGRLPPLTGPVFGSFGISPSAAAVRRELARVADTTKVAVAGTTTVAGRPAYRLVVAPRRPGTLVGALEIDVDSRTRLPLAVSVFSRDRKDAVMSVAFSSVSFGPVDPSLLDFRPPPEARVKRVGLQGAGLDGLLALTHSVKTLGHGWTSVLAVRVPSPGSGRLPGALSGALLQFQGPILSVHVAGRADHSWVMIGAVPLSRLASLDRRLP